MWFFALASRVTQWLKTKLQSKLHDEMKQSHVSYNTTFSISRSYPHASTPSSIRQHRCQDQTQGNLATLHPTWLLQGPPQSNPLSLMVLLIMAQPHLDELICGGHGNLRPTLQTSNFTQLLFTKSLHVMHRRTERFGRPQARVPAVILPRLCPDTRALLDVRQKTSSLMRSPP